MPGFYDSTIARFWSKVDVRGPDECWLWTDKPCRGYGHFTVRRPTKRIWKAHAFSFALAFGDRTAPCVLHRCDVPLCVNPSHLWQGTQKENIADMVAKGRQHHQRGSSNGNARLTEQDIAEMRRLLAVGTLQTAIAERFGVTQSRISQIKRRVAWSHMADTGGTAS